MNRLGRLAVVCLIAVAGPACLGSGKAPPKTPAPGGGGPPPPASGDTILPAWPGSMMVGQSTDFIPLYNGQVLIGDQSTSRVNLLNVVTGAVDDFYQLTAAPADLELDPALNYLYAALVSATQLARIDLSTGQVAYIPVSAPVASIALGNNGIVFASVPTSYSGPVAVIDGPAAAVVTTVPGTGAGFDRLIVFNRATDELITGSWGLSPSTLTRYSYNPTTHALTQLQQSWNTGSNGQELVLSPNQLHLGYPNGAGNGYPSYTIYDYNPTDVTVSYGAWNTGPYPRAIAWSPDSSRVLASNGFDLQLFDAVTHAPITSFPLSYGGCVYSSILRTGVSKGGKIGFGLTNCGPGNTGPGQLHWVLLPP